MNVLDGLFDSVPLVRPPTPEERVVPPNQRLDGLPCPGCGAPLAYTGKVERVPQSGDRDAVTIYPYACENTCTEVA